MAKAVAKSTSLPAWLSLAQARELVAEILLSLQFAELQILEWLRQGRVRWRWVRVIGRPRKGRSLDQEAAALWASGFHSVLLDWNESFAQKVTIVGRSGQTVGSVVVIGIRLSRDDIFNCLPLTKGALAQTLGALTVTASDASVLVKGALAQTLDAAALSATATVSGPGPEDCRPQETGAASWIAAEAKRMKKADEIPDKITHFARELADRMDEAAKTDRAIRPITAPSIKNKLAEWGLWPPDRIK